MPGQHGQGRAILSQPLQGERAKDGQRPTLPCTLAVPGQDPKAKGGRPDTDTRRRPLGCKPRSAHLNLRPCKNMQLHNQTKAER